MKIGVVGSGIAGLVAAWLFTRSGHQVVLFEKSPSPGMSHSSVNYPNLSCSIDVPLRLFNFQHWKQLFRVYRELKIDIDPVRVWQSFSDSQGNCYLQVDEKRLFGTAIGNLLTPKSRSIFEQSRRLKMIGLRDLPFLDDSIEFEEFLDAQDFGTDFTNEFLYPLLAATVCTCSIGALKRFPAKIVLQILANISERKGQASSLFRVRKGSAEVTRKLIAEIDEVRTASEVVSIDQQESRVELSFLQRGKPEVFHFEHVLIATQADHAIRLLKQPADLEKRMLSNFAYEKVDVVVHRDESLMPKDRNAWSTFNFRTMQHAGGNLSAGCTIWLNQFSKGYDSETNIFQSINSIRQPDANLLIKESRLSRPIVNRATQEGWKLMEQLNGENGRRIWFVGSYASPGVPLLETGVESVVNIAKKLDVDVSLFSEPRASTLAGQMSH